MKAAKQWNLFFTILSAIGSVWSWRTRRSAAGTVAAASFLLAAIIGAASWCGRAFQEIPDDRGAV